TWQLARSDYDMQTNQWKPKQIIEEKQHARYTSAVYDKNGTLWVAYSVQTPKGREVVIKHY
ncbi:MAG: sialidase family protein, partial [Anaerohalosphaeraceae bacterium]